MAEEHAKAITAAREKLVAQRRNLVTDLGRTAKGRTKGNLIKVITLQAAIDASIRPTRMRRRTWSVKLVSTETMRHARPSFEFCIGEIAP
jgi:hypothetical protein